MSERLEFCVLLTDAGWPTRSQRDAAFMGFCYRHGFGRRRWVLMQVSLPPGTPVVAVPRRMVARGHCAYRVQVHSALSSAAVRASSRLKGVL